MNQLNFKEPLEKDEMNFHFRFPSKFPLIDDCGDKQKTHLVVVVVVVVVLKGAVGNVVVVFDTVVVFVITYISFANIDSKS